MNTSKNNKPGKEQTSSSKNKKTTPKPNTKNWKKLWKNTSKTTGGGRGRPSKLDFETVQKIVDIFRIDGTVEEACSQAEISTSTFYNFYNQDFYFLDKNGQKKSFKTTIDKAREFPFIVAKRTLVQHAHSDPKIAIEFLKRRHKDYKDKQETVTTSYAFTWIQIEDATN